jgi:hypothetical protein
MWRWRGRLIRVVGSGSGARMVRATAKFGIGAAAMWLTGYLLSSIVEQSPTISAFFTNVIFGLAAIQSIYGSGLSKIIQMT